MLLTFFELEYATVSLILEFTDTMPYLLFHRFTHYFGSIKILLIRFFSWHYSAHLLGIQPCSPIVWCVTVSPLTSLYNWDRYLPLLSREDHFLLGTKLAYCWSRAAVLTPSVEHYVPELGLIAEVDRMTNMMVELIIIIYNLPSIHTVFLTIDVTLKCP